MAAAKRAGITEMHPKLSVVGVGGGGGNAVNNMVAEHLPGATFIVANTDAQALATSKAPIRIQLGAALTQGLGAGSSPLVGEAAAGESLDEIMQHLEGTHMCFVTAGMGGGTGTGAAPVIARAARDAGILTVAVVTKPFTFEGSRRMRAAEDGILRLRDSADTVIVIPNQNLFRISNAKTTFADAFATADRVLYSGVSCITDLIIKEGLINLDFADVKSIMRDMGPAMMGTGEATGAGRAIKAAEAAIANPLLDEASMSGAQGLLVSIAGGSDMTLFEVDEAATRTGMSIQMPKLDSAVTNALARHLFQPERLEAILSGLAAREADRQADGKAEALRVEKEHAERQAALDRLYELVERGFATLDDVLKERIARAQTELAIAKEELRRVRAREAAPSAITSEMIVRFGELMTDRVTNGEVPFRNAYIRSVVQQVVVSEDEIVIHGHPAVLREALKAATQGGGVPSSIQEWRTRQDSNL